MPWNNNTGGWRGGGPWGSGPQQGGSQPPDLEEILRRGQDRLRRAIPPGGRGNMAVAGLAVAGLAVIWLMNAIYTVQPDELGIELVFGKPKETVSEPGLHFHFWPVETVEKVSIAQRRDLIGTVAAAGAPGRRAGALADSLMLAGDQSIVDIDFTVIWRVVQPRNFLFEVTEPQAFVRRVAESAMREFVGRSRAEEVRTDRRAEVEEAVRTLLQATLDTYNAGVQVVSVQLERADPPGDVIDAFEEVQRAQQDLDRFQREAEQYANRRLGEARGEASQIREAAIGYRSRVVEEATGEAQRFLAVYEQYALAEDVTRKRLFLETMERVLAASDKVIMETGAANGAVPYLPLNELQRRRPETQQPRQEGSQ